MSVVTRVTLREIDGRIADVRSVLDVTTGRLVELDADLTRQLLESSTSLRGVTAEAWADASSRHAALWRAQIALERSLTTVVEARGERRYVTQSALHELDGLLQGLQVELPLPDAGAPVRLTHGADPVEAVTMGVALERMSGDYELVAGVVLSVAEVWGPVSEVLHELAETLSHLGRGEAGALVTSPNELRATQRAVDEALRTARDDPLGLSRRSVSDLEVRVAQLASVHEEAAQERVARTHQLREAEQWTEAALDALAGCRDELWRTWRRRSRCPTVPKPTWRAWRCSWRTSGRRAVERSGRTGAMRARCHRRARDIMARVRALTAAVGGQLARRDQLRGLLGAYRAKVDALGLAEEAELEARFAAARELLSVAPCDIEAAQRAVQGYMDAARRTGRPGAEAGS